MARNTQLAEPASRPPLEWPKPRTSALPMASPGVPRSPAQSPGWGQFKGSFLFNALQGLPTISCLNNLSGNYTLRGDTQGQGGGPATDPSASSRVAAPDHPGASQSRQ